MNPLSLEVNEKIAETENFKAVVKRLKLNEDYANSKQLVLKNLEVKDNKIRKINEMLTYLETKVEQFRLSAYNPHWAEIGGLDVLIRSTNRISLADKHGPMSGWGISSYNPSLSLLEEGTLNGPPSHSPSRKHWLYFNIMATIEYAKTFMFFHRLYPQDQIILIRHVTLACVNLLVSFASVIRKFDTTIHPDGSKQFVRHQDYYSSTVMSIAPLVRYQVQPIEYVLLKAMCLCNPAVPDLSDYAQLIIAKERRQYAEALFDHCIRERAEGPGHFTDLISIIDLLERQQRMQKDLHLLHIGPLVAKAPKENVIQIIEDVMNA